jgi:AmmeMemoRadiSam system protein B
VYSGAIAGTAFAWLAREAPASSIRRVLLMGTGHGKLVGVASTSADGFDTPLGLVPVDRDAVQALEDGRLVHRDDAAHGRDHSLEVQLPFLIQSLGADIPVIPLLVGAGTPDEVSRVLEEVWDDRTAVIVSSDLSHYLDADSAREIDAVTARVIESLDPHALAPGDACGRVAISGLLKVARRRRLRAATLDLRNSGDTAGPRDRVVGYGAFGFTDVSL